MLEVIVLVLVLLWLIGLAGHIAGVFIHVLLVIALIVFIYRLIISRNP